MVYTPAVKEIIWFRSIIAELKFKLKYGAVLFSDNQAAKAIAEDPVFRKRTKAVGIQYHFVKEAIAEGIETDRNLADINTKPLVRATFEMLRDRISRGIDIPISVIKVRTTEDLGSVGFLSLVEFSLFNTNILSYYLSIIYVKYRISRQLSFTV